MITHETAELLRLDAVAFRVFQRRKRMNTWEPYSFEARASGVGVISAHTDATEPTVKKWFKEAGGDVQSVITDGAQQAMIVIFKAAKHD